MTGFQVARFLLDRGFNIPSPVLLAKVGRAYVAAIDRFAERGDIPVVRFAKGESKEQIARSYFEAAERAGRFGVVLIGVAQEKAMAWRGWRRGGPDGHPHFEFGRQAVFVNHYYFYVRDPDWGPAFVKTCAYAPFPMWLCLNGHEWAKRQAEKAGLAFEALDNGFRATEDAAALAAICDRLGPREIRRFFRRWQARLPSPFDAADRRRGYRHVLCFGQLELSDTRVFDRPAAGRAWFEQTIRDQLDLGRPDNIAIVFNRKVLKTTPWRFHTRVITRGVEPAIQVHYKHSKVKQYFKEGRALRTETTVNDTYDFGVGRLVTQANWDALLQIGHEINERLLDAQLQACACAPRRPDARARRTAVANRRRPARSRAAPRRPARDGATRLTMRLQPPARATDQPLTAHARRRPDPRLHAAPDDLRPAPPTAQGPHPPPARHPALHADRRRPPPRRLLHQDLRANHLPLTRRARSPAPGPDRASHAARPSLARP